MKKLFNFLKILVLYPDVDPTHDLMLKAGFKHNTSLLLASYSIDINTFPSELKQIVVTIEKGNQYVYLRSGQLNKPREQDELITLFNADIKGALTMKKVLEIYNVLK